MDMTYISVICRDEAQASENLSAMRKAFASKEKARVSMENAEVAGNEIFILVPHCGGLGFSLSALKEALVAPARVDMFNLERNADGEYSRFWYLI